MPASDAGLPSHATTIMTLPNGDRAIVDIRKLKDYCLNPHHSRGRNKARVFASLGIREGDANELRALLKAAAEGEARLGMWNQYGQRYVIDFDLVCRGKSARIRSTWIILTGQDLPRLTTCYVL